MDTELQKALKFLRNVADRNGYLLNPDLRTLERIALSMVENRRNHKRYFCPCKQHHPVKAEVDPVCPCDESKDEIRRDGFCDCHVFFDESGYEHAKMRPGLLSTVACPG